MPSVASSKWARWLYRNSFDLVFNIVNLLALSNTISIWGTRDEVRDPNWSWSNRLGLRTGVNRDRSTESGSTIYGLHSLIRAPSNVWKIWSGHYLRSGESDQSPAQSLDSLIIAWSRVWRVLWYDLESLNRALSRVWKVWSGARGPTQNGQSPEKKKSDLTPEGTVFEEHFPMSLDEHQRLR